MGHVRIDNPWMYDHTDWSYGLLIHMCIPFFFVTFPFLTMKTDQKSPYTLDKRTYTTGD